jgi:hypothetical protein
VYLEADMALLSTCFLEPLSVSIGKKEVIVLVVSSGRGRLSKGDLRPVSLLHV